jgi:hypothetical protein
MALENGGLDAQIEQRMDAYRGNPQQLQQRYGQNKELLDLLALQKLTSEKQAASRDMQMKMQQQPGTIAQQREQEALELTKQEMGSTLGDLAGRTKSTLDQKQMNQQKNMGKMAQAASRPPQAGIGALMGGATRPQPRPAVPPQAQGLAAARMAQGPSKFAGGGIVSFAQGQGVSGQSGLQGEQTLEEKVARINARPELSAGQKQALINQIIAQEPEQPSSAQRMTPIGRESSARMPGQRGMVPVGSGMSQLDVMAELNPSIAPTRPTPVPAPTTAAPAPMPAPAAPTPTPGGITDLLDQKGQGPAPAVPTAGETAASFQVPQTAGAADTGILAAQNMTSADAALRKGTQFSDEYTGRAAASESYEDMKSRLAEFDEANYGPGDDLNAFLIGMGGTGSIGSAMKGGYNAMNRSKNNRRNRMMDEFQLEKDRIGTDAVFSASGIKLGTQLAADAAANERSIRSAAAALGAAKIRAATADADRLANVYKAELKAVDDAAARAVQLATNERLGDQTRLTAAIDVQSDVARTRASLLEDQLSNSMTLQRLEMQKSQVSDDPEAIAAINQNIAAETAQIALTVESVLNTPTPSGLNLLELEATAADTIRKLMGVSGLTEDDVTGVTVDGE